MPRRRPQESAAMRAFRSREAAQRRFAGNLHPQEAPTEAAQAGGEGHPPIKGFVRGAFHGMRFGPAAKPRGFRAGIGYWLVGRPARAVAHFATHTVGGVLKGPEYRGPANAAEAGVQVGSIAHRAVTHHGKWLAGKTWHYGGEALRYGWAKGAEFLGGGVVGVWKGKRIFEGDTAPQPVEAIGRVAGAGVHYAGKGIWYAGIGIKKGIQGGYALARAGLNKLKDLRRRRRERRTEAEHREPEPRGDTPETPERSWLDELGEGGEEP